MKEDAAILLIEFQKTWTDKGIFKRIIAKELKRLNVLENTKRLLETARKHKVKIIQAPLILDKSDKKRYRKTPLPARLFSRFTKATWKAEFTDGLFKKSDIVVEGRCGFDACQGSNLEQLLAQHKIQSLYVCGFTTDHCVKETMNSLMNKGYDCTMVFDCTATRSRKIQSKIEKEFIVISTQKIIDKITSER